MVRSLVTVNLMLMCEAFSGHGNTLFHEVAPGVNLGYRSDGVEPSESRTGLFWLGGFNSEMAGSKAQALADLAEAEGRNAFRFDYSGHGISGGQFRDGTISKWLTEAIALFIEKAPGPRIIIGSSMGGWLALLLTKYLTEHNQTEAARIKGLVLIAPAADMTEDLMWAKYNEDIRSEITSNGFFSEPSKYSDEPYIITHDLIEDGRQHLLLTDYVDVAFPVRILQGEDDPDVPWRHGFKVYNALRGSDVSLSLIKYGDHRLSTLDNLKFLKETCLALCERADNATS